MADNSEESTEQNVPEENTANIATFEFGALPSRSELRKDPKRSEDFDLEREKNEKRFRIITVHILIYFSERNVLESHSSLLKVYKSIFISNNKKKGIS